MHQATPDDALSELQRLQAAARKLWRITDIATVVQPDHEGVINCGWRGQSLIHRERKRMPRRINIPSFSPFLYRYRNLVERSSARSNTSETSPRASKSTKPTIAIVKLVAARIWMRFMSR
jgi:hypothetical protein